MFNKIRDFLNNNVSVFYGAIIALSLLLLGKVIEFAYFNAWDDYLHISQNYWIINRTFAESLQYFWTNIHKGLYIPFTYSIWKLVWIGIEPLRNPEKAMVYHFLCLLFHTINACLVFKIFLKLNFSKISAFLGAMIFLLHPVQVESFAWISEFKGLFAFFWGATATIQFLNWENTKKKLPYFLAILFFIFSILSKPSTTTLPILFTAIWFCTEKKRLGRYFSYIAVFFVIAAILAVITRFAQPSSIGYYEGLPIYCRIIIPLHAIGFYLSQLIIPVPLVSIYPEQLPTDVMSKLDTQFYWLLGLLSVILPVRYKSFRWIWLFALLILPNSGIIPFDYQDISVVADRYQYLVMPVAIFGLLKLLKPLNKVKIICTTVIIVIFAIMTFKRTDDWRNSGTLHYSALNYNKKTPHLYVNLIEFLTNTNHFKAVKELFEYADSCGVKDDLLDICHATYFIKIKEDDSAKAILEKVISGFLDADGNLVPSKGRNNLITVTTKYAFLLYSTKKYDEAILSANAARNFAKKNVEDYLTVLQLLLTIYINRSISDLSQDGDLDSSIAISSEILSIEKENSQALVLKGLAFYMQDKNDSTLAYWEKFTEKLNGKEKTKSQEFIDKYIKQGKKASDLKNSEIEEFISDPPDKNKFNFEER